MSSSIWIGFDPREAVAFGVCRHSIQRRLTQPIPVKGLVLSELQRTGLYQRPLKRKGHQLWDVMSNAPMSTEFGCSRFFVPLIAKTSWALFLDCDILVRANLSRLFEQIDGTKAVYVVKHDHEPAGVLKMDDQVQTQYARKNWSSLMVFNNDHRSNRKLTKELLNTAPGRDLHRFCWLKDKEIGELHPEWNHLVGHTRQNSEPKVVHWTAGGPWFPRYENVQYADDWRAELADWAA